MKLHTCFGKGLLLTQLLFGTGLASSAAVFLSNLDGNDGTSTALFSSDRSKAMGFDIGATPVSLGSVILRLQFGELSNVNFEVSLFDNSGSNNPGISLLTFSNPDFSANVTANFTFDAPAPYQLAANTRYWVVVRDNNNSGTTSSGRWMASSPTVVPVDPDNSTVEATHFGARFSVGTFPPVGASGTLNSYALVAVPEPADYLLAAGLGLVGLAAYRRTGL